jgi:hypothetical protein
MRWPECRVWRCAPWLRRSKPQRPGATSVRVTGSFGGSAVTPCQAARRCRGPKRWLANSDHRGRCGANLKHRARDAERFGGLAVCFDRWAAVFSGIAVPLRRREMPQPAGPTDPGVPRALGLLSEGASTGSLGRKKTRRENEGGCLGFACQGNAGCENSRASFRGAAKRRTRNPYSAVSRHQHRGYGFRLSRSLSSGRASRGPIGSAGMTRRGLQSE